MDGLHAREICTLFRWFKEGPPGAIPIEHDHRSVGLLQAATWEDAGGPPLAQLASWHGAGRASGSSRASSKRPTASCSGSRTCAAS